MLPSDNQWDTLEQFNPIKPYQEWNPEYKQLDKDNFTLTYIKGFDSPYLTYNSRRNKWEKK